MKLKLKEIEKVLVGLDELVKFENNSTNKLTLSGTSRYVLYRNMRKAKEIMEDVERTRQEIFLEVGKGQTQIQQGSLEAQEFLNKYGTFLDSYESTEFQTISLIDLNLDKNQIPFTILGLLDPIIKE